MPKQFTEAEASRHNALFAEARSLVEGEFHFEGQEVSGPPSALSRQKLERAIELLENALLINPENGAAYFMLARISLRQGDKEGNLKYLIRAEEAIPENASIARELILAGLGLGQFDRAVEFGTIAIKRHPEDGGCFVNLGLALLVTGRAGEAATAFAKAAELEPENAFTPKLVTLAHQVEGGEVPIPRTEQDILKAIQTL